jgi:spore coat protein U-like protein
MKSKFMNLAALGGVGALFLGLLAGGPAFAVSATGTMSVTADVEATCAITSTPMTFGSLPLTGGNTTQATTTTATVTYTCTTGTTPTNFYVQEGQNTADASGGNYNYAMTDGTNYLSYGLDVTNGGTFTLAATGTSTASPNVVGDGTFDPTTETFTIAGQIAANQTPPAGAYADTVTFAVEF